MDFANEDRKLDLSEVIEIESEVGLRFPDSLRRLFCEHNGGEPIPYVFERDHIQTIVSETIPLVSTRSRSTAAEVYQNLVVKKSLAEEKYFPFALDAGGEVFFVDCDSTEGAVYYLRTDSAAPELDDLGLSLDEFFASLESES